MSGKYFSNQGQIAQLVVAVLALVVGIVIAWPQLNAHMNLLQLWPIVVVPLAAFLIFQAGRMFGASAALSSAKSAAENDDVYNATVDVLDVTIKVGSVWNAYDLRITAASLQKFKQSKGEECEGVHLVVKGGLAGGQFVGGEKTKRLDYNEFLVPVSSWSVNSEKSCLFSFGTLPGHVYVSIIRVDHINEPGQEISLSVVRLKAINKKRLLAS